MADSFINFGILARPQRHRWSREYLNRHGFRVGRFHEKVLNEIETILGEKQALFWRMAAPQVLLLREYYNLKELMLWNRDEIKDDKQEIAEARRSKRKNDQWVRYTKIASSSYSETLKGVSNFAEAIIEKYIFPQWKALGFSNSD